jgi:hypothetical protein
MEIKFIFVILCVVAYVVISFYSMYRLILRIEVYEDIVSTQDQVLTVLRESVLRASNKLKEHDTRGHYNSDDDLGAYFKTLLEVDRVITEYIQETINEKSKEGG